MARIRSIKPEFWEDEAVGQLSPYARLLFIGTWTLADDEGLLRWTPDYINASLFMYDNLSNRRIEQMMQEVAAGLVFTYTTGSRQQLAYVVNFRRHQKINRPQPGRFPPPSLQSPATLAMYARRDGYECHLCSGPINRQRMASVPLYPGNEVIPAGNPDLNMSPDHVVPRVAGGTDYPSNIRAAHVACNKSRGARPVEAFSVPDSVRRALGHALNHSVNHAPPDVVNDAPPSAMSGSPPSRAPADQGSGNREQGEEHAGHVAPKGPVPRTAGSKRAEDLNATSRRPDTQRLLNAWEIQRGSPLLPDARRQWNRAVDQVLDQGATQADVAGALPVLAARGLGPSLLASVIEEQRDKRANRPIHERGPDEVTDADLTRAVLDDLLGEDSWMPPPCPDDIEQGPPGPRRAWFAARRDERLAQRRAEARQVLARNQAVTT